MIRRQQKPKGLGYRRFLYSSLLKYRSVLDLFVCAVVLSSFTFLLEYTKSTPIIIAAFASSSLSMVVLPISRTNSIRAIFLSYIIAASTSSLLSVLFGSLGWHFTGSAAIEFLFMIFLTLYIFHKCAALHPPAIGATLSYFLGGDATGGFYLIYSCILIGLILMLIKSYLYLSNPSVLRPEYFKKEFTREYIKTAQRSRYAHFSYISSSYKERRKKK